MESSMKEDTALTHDWMAGVTVGAKVGKATAQHNCFLMKSLIKDDQEIA